MTQNKFTYKSVLFSIVFTFISAMLSKTTVSGCFFNLSFLISVCYIGKNAQLYPLLFVISFAVTGLYDMLIPATVSAALLSFIFTIYTRKKKRPQAEIIVYSVLSILPFILITKSTDIIPLLIEGGISVVLMFIFISSSSTVFIKKFTAKISGDEYLCLAIFSFLTELGFIRVFSIQALKSVCIFIMLFSAYVNKNTLSSVAVAVISALAPAVFEASFTPIALYSLMSLLTSVFMKNSRIISAFSLLALDMLFLMVFKTYGDFVYTDAFYGIVPVTVFLFFPKSILEQAKKSIYSYSDKILSRYAINRLRSSLSNKLYGVSDVFCEMQSSFNKLKDCVSTDEDLYERMCDDIICNVCVNCLSYNRCKSKNLPDRTELIKILSVGVAKNRVSLIDLTKNFTENCGFTNSIIFEINALISKYKEKIKELDDVSSGKELITLQSEGVASVLKGMAFDMSKSLDYLGNTEQKLSDALRKKGVYVNEIMALSDDNEPEIDVVLPRSVLNKRTFINTVSNVVGREMNIVARTTLSESKCAVTLKPAPITDAAFGLAHTCKNGSVKSGDTHSLTKLTESKFLIALSDGMGSGIKAENTSATAISLIESFYKAGLDGNLILSIVNKVLALNTDDNFSAMDILTVDLFSLKADFIKIGAPTSYVLSDDAIKLIEGSSLPLGILDDMKPTGCSTDLTLGNTVIMLTDGISDAFGSSTDLLDFLRTLEGKNPQVIADEILNKALSLQGDTAKDDMTVLAVRIFAKSSHKGVA